MGDRNYYILFYGNTELGRGHVGYLDGFIICDDSNIKEMRDHYNGRRQTFPLSKKAEQFGRENFGIVDDRKWRLYMGASPSSIGDDWA